MSTDALDRILDAVESAEFRAPADGDFVAVALTVMGLALAGCPQASAFAAVPMSAFGDIERRLLFCLLSRRSGHRTKSLP
jgi:hypothetical protein